MENDDKDLVKEIIQAQEEAKEKVRIKRKEAADKRNNGLQLQNEVEVPKSTFKEDTVAGQMIKMYGKYIKRIIKCRYKPAWAKFKEGYLIELGKGTMPEGQIIDEEGFSLSVWSSNDVNINLLGMKGNSKLITYKRVKYIEFDVDYGKLLSTAAGISLMKDKMETFYEFVVVVLSQSTKLDVGDIDLAGYDEIVERCNQLLRYDDERIANRHILLYGDPGCGKSMIAKRLVKDNPDLICLNIDVHVKWTEFVPVLNKVLTFCKKKMIILIDEIDEIGLSRDLNPEDTFSLLRILDGIATMKSIKFIATTNRINVLDGALLRPGRLGPPIKVDAPTKEQLIMIIEYYNDKYKVTINPDDVLNSVQNHTTGCDIRTAYENCIIYGEELTLINVIKYLKELKVNKEVKGMYQ